MIQLIQLIPVTEMKAEFCAELKAELTAELCAELSSEKSQRGVCEQRMLELASVLERVHRENSLLLVQLSNKVLSIY